MRKCRSRALTESSCTRGRVDRGNSSSFTSLKSTPNFNERAELTAEKGHLVTGVVEWSPSVANNSTVQRLTEGEQSFSSAGEQMHLKVSGIVSGIPLKGTQKSAQTVRAEDHRF
ncbi:hypothetical protein TYRP_007737 [Tyrophagus putrescentiae]|nr:hypothetical protein TYRP_007737 [Tyrophagus putrescentiae]